jgi:hypothetical protein
MNAIIMNRRHIRFGEIFSVAKRAVREVLGVRRW